MGYHGNSTILLYLTRGVPSGQSVDDDDEKIAGRTKCEKKKSKYGKSYLKLNKGENLYVCVQIQIGREINFTLPIGMCTWRIHLYLIQISGDGKSP